jgi:hypothetical protein
MIQLAGRGYPKARWTRGVVVAEPTSQPTLSSQAVGVILHIYVFLFDAAPEPLDESVVDPPTPPIHAHVHAHRLTASDMRRWNWHPDGVEINGYRQRSAPSGREYRTRCPDRWRVPTPPHRLHQSIAATNT